MDKEIRRARLDTPDTLHHVIGQGIEMPGSPTIYPIVKNFIKWSCIVSIEELKTSTSRMQVSGIRARIAIGLVKR